ncbi:MAG: DUF1549 domain-containing protein [Verrucomicrobia bacterium]|nr:DUF1549 domain-containing protein [Verrucomicrobiota bacterium]
MPRYPACIFPLLVAIASGAPLGAAELGASGQRQFFENHIRPLLAQRCYECHGEKKQKAGLRLDSAARFAKGGDSGPAVVAGDLEKSLLITAVRPTDQDLQMPPDEPLPPDEVALLEKWVAMGAPYPSETGAVAGAAVDANGFTAEQRAFWTFQPLAQPTPPALPGNRWVRGDIDRFIAAKHAELKLAPAPEAGREELARRLYFDLHGLPPTRAQLDAFVRDARPDAYERLVDELLASPRYGERWAQHWLDLVRYADSDGYRADALRPTAWPYRDWVIRTFNADLPYDRFVREQLAGDELAPDKPEVLVATAYLRNPIYEWNQRDVHGQANLIVDDLTSNAGEVFLGLSFACARCHDHKFDPILQKDYFALRAFFEGVLWPGDLKLATAAERARHAGQQAAWETATADLRRQIEALVGPERDRLVRRAYDRFTDDIRAMMDKPAARRTPYEHVIATIANKQLDYEIERYEPQKSLKTPETKARYAALQVELKKFDHLKPAPLPEAFVATDAGPTAPPTTMKGRRGLVRDVTPGFPTLIAPEAPQIAPLPNSTGRRTALAAWITRPDNPLATRTIVNRVWQHHFGRGLAPSPNDLGKLGGLPSHPELLDWLAQRFVAQGWSFKRLHREILLSATYRQTARVPVPPAAALVDPANVFLWRFSPARLDAEQVRDAMLAASGELDLKEGGPAQDAATSSRRSIYTTRRRNTPAELYRALDAPPGFTSAADRQTTSTPLQALLFLNGDWPLARARKLGERIKAPEAAWQAVLGRAPTADEQRMAEDFLERRMTAGRPLPDRPMDPVAPVALTAPGQFHENTPQERLLVRSAPREGDDFTVEAIVTLDSLDSGASVRVIASRWNGDKISLDSHGWALGVTGKKSAHKPGSLIVQLVGEDPNMVTTYEVVPSGLTLTPGKTHHVVARISCGEGSVAFQVRDLASSGAAPRTAWAKHNIVGKLGAGLATPAIGGLAKRSGNQFDGRIDGVRVAPGLLADEMLSAEPAQWPSLGAMTWDARRPLPAGYEWQAGASNAESSDPRVRAMTDLCHVLLNSNEFLHQH